MTPFFAVPPFRGGVELLYSVGDGDVDLIEEETVLSLTTWLNARMRL